MTKQITIKRAELLREWLLACSANDEQYYESTLVDCVPDGDDLQTVLDDLQDGFYDDNIDYMLSVYEAARRRYGKHGWYVSGVLYMDENETLAAMDVTVPEKIYKGGKIEAENVRLF